VIELTPHGLANGGEAVAKVDGKTWFIAGAMPGDVVLASIEQDRGSWGRAKLVEIVQPAPDRVAAPCRHFASCGGCQWQFIDAETQRVAKGATVQSQLVHLGRFDDDVVVRPTLAAGDPYGYRNRMDFRLSGGRPALFKARSKELEPLDECLLLVPALAELFGRLGDLDGLNFLTIRAGANTGDLLAVIGGRLPAHAGSWDVPIGRVRRGVPSVESGRDHLFEEVNGLRFRITANAFFQNNTVGAGLLVDLVHEALEPARDDVLLDAYAGGGLFSVALGPQVSRLVAVETSPLGLADLEHNLEEADVPAADIFAAPFEELIDDIESVTIAVCDPPRTGLGATGVEVLTDCRPRAIAYVSCDPASLARDARLIADHGYTLDWVAPVDMFPQTHHIESVARFALS